MEKLNLAIKIANEIDSDKQRVVAIITDKKDRILSIGVNSYKKSHPIQFFYAKKFKQGFKIFQHAEINAITKLDDKPYNIYVSRLTPSGKIGLAKPCPICELAIKDVGIKNVHYTR